MRKWLVLIITVIGCDQISKWVADNQLTLYEQNPLFPYLNLTLIYNTGASFGLLSNAGGWQRWLFIIIAVAVILYLYTWMKKLHKEDKWIAAGIALIIGGAVGNLIDRVFRGYVVDFIDVYYKSYHWPVFNIADSAIVIGAMILVIMIAFERKTPTA